MWTCTGGPNQVWNIVNGSTPPPPPPTTTTSSTTSSMTRSTTTRTTSTTSTTSSTPPASTAHVIHPGASASICLSAASNVNNAAVEIETCNGSTCALFRFPFFSSSLSWPFFNLKPNNGPS
jgi:hypothetical protein